MICKLSITVIDPSPRQRTQSSSILSFTNSSPLRTIFSLSNTPEVLHIGQGERDLFGFPSIEYITYNTLPAVNATPSTINTNISIGSPPLIA